MLSGLHVHYTQTPARKLAGQSSAKENRNGFCPSPARQSDAPGMQQLHLGSSSSPRSKLKQACIFQKKLPLFVSSAHLTLKIDTPDRHFGSGYPEGFEGDFNFGSGYPEGFEGDFNFRSPPPGMDLGRHFPASIPLLVKKLTFIRDECIPQSAQRIGAKKVGISVAVGGVEDKPKAVIGTHIAVTSSLGCPNSLRR